MGIPRRSDIVGMKFGKLTILRYQETRKNKHAYWLCKCDCGNEIVVNTNSLKTGNTQSCGCLHGERHGHCSVANRHDRIYRIWCNIKSRCLNPNTPAYKNYGGRGITICDKWLSFVGFLEDMQKGYAEHLTIERIDNNKGYDKENCKWATNIEQSRNKRTTVKVVHNGKPTPLKTLCEKFKTDYFYAYNRIVRNGLDAQIVFNGGA